ncbi:hypothetical protein, partial [Abditibacterium utsteinense]|uniref:hypothetical protein n=1 Tax=Abditibacterium utsteinense TaxID=1960156 RepID=UPI001EE77D2D
VANHRVALAVVAPQLHCYHDHSSQNLTALDHYPKNDTNSIQYSPPIDLPALPASHAEPHDKF